MNWVLKDDNDYRLCLSLGNRRYLFADECMYPGRGYSASVYYVDLDSFHSDEIVDGVSLMKLLEEEETDEDRAYLIADSRDECDYETKIFSDEESMWTFVREEVAGVMGV